ncbi:hypothetical protein D3C76_781450 [compost metagenome]
MFALFGQALGLHLQTLQRLASRIVLRLERAQTHRQLMGMILVLPRFLPHPIQALAQTVALGQQQLALLGVQRHAVEGFLQLQARLTDVFVLQRALFIQLGEFFVEAGSAQGQLLGLGFSGRQLGFQFSLLAGFVLQQAAQMLAAVLLLTLLRPEILQLGFQGFDRDFALFALKAQLLDFLATGEHAAFRFTGPTHAQEMPTDPVTVTADQALPGRQLPAQGQCLLKAVDRLDLPQPWRQIDLRLDLVQQAARHPYAIAGRAEQAQVALGKARQIEIVEIVHQHRLQVGSEHGFHRQLPTGLDLQAFGQARAIRQVLFAQPFGGAGARIERGLLQGFERSQSTVEPLQIALGLLLRRQRLL